MRPSISLLLAALIASAAAPARAQGTGPGDTGHLDRGTRTDEVDDCRDQGVGQTEAEARAYEHYERGLNLYEQGDYRAAIDEFVLAYCHKASATVLKDIAQSFERMVDYEKAVAYLERYILESPEREQEERRVQSARAQVLRNLSARVRIATEPPGASVTLTSTSGARSAHGVANASEPLEIRQGTYVLTVDMAGYQSISETIHVNIGQPYSYYYRLEPRKGVLRVVVVPGNARIFVDKRLVAPGSYVEKLPIGTYEISAEADGYVSRKRTVEITDSDYVDVALELERMPRSGRRELLMAASLGGLFMSSGLASLFDGRESVVGLAVPLGLGLGLGAAYLGVPDDVTVGTSSYIIGATTIGTIQGALIASYATCEHKLNSDGIAEFEGCDDNVRVASAMAGGVGGLALSLYTAPRLGLDAGDAALVNSGALWGAIGGSLFYAVFDEDARIFEPLVLGGLNLGILTGALMAQRVSISRGHVALIDVSGVLGMLVGSAVADVADQEEGISERIPHGALAGMAVGLIAGTYLTRNMDETPALGAVSPTLGATTDAGGKSTMTIGVGLPWP